MLIINDAFLKWHYSNFLTGKLSDFAGLLIFPIFVAFVFPRSKKYVCCAVGLGFIFWKSPYSSFLLDWLNSVSIFSFSRVVDCTDLWALAMLPFSHKIINKHNRAWNLKPVMTGSWRVVVLILAAMSFMATSMSRFEIPKGTIYIGKSYKIKNTKEGLLEKLSALGYEWTYLSDTLSSANYRYEEGFYQVENVVLDNGFMTADTLKNVKFFVEQINESKVRLHIINVTLMKEGDIQDWRILKSFHRSYKKRVKKQLIEKLQATN